MRSKSSLVHIELINPVHHKRDFPLRRLLDLLQLLTIETEILHPVTFATYIPECGGQALASWVGELKRVLRRCQGGKGLDRGTSVFDGA